MKGTESKTLETFVRLVKEQQIIHKPLPKNLAKKKYFN